MSFKFARLISILFHPILLVLYMIMFPLYIQLHFEWLPYQFLMLFGVIIAGYLVFPSLALYLLYKIHYIKTLQFEGKREKMIAYLTLGLFYYTTFQIVVLLNIYPLLYIYMLAPILIIACYLSISFFYEINSHALFLGAFIGFFLGLGYNFQQNNLIIILLLVLMSGWVLSSQLFLKKYTFREVYSSFFIGLSVFVLMFLIVTK